MRPWTALGRRGIAPTVAIAALVTTLSACAPPSYRFTASAADDVAVKVPRSWNMISSGVPANSDGTPGAAGNWMAVFDAAAHPSVDHVQAAHTTAPVALMRTVVVTKAQGQSLSADDLRDVLWPVSGAGRATAASQGFTGTGFQLRTDDEIHSKTADGVHVVFRYDLGQGPEVFDQVALIDKTKTRVDVFIVHCNQACFDADSAVISDTVRSFTVRAP